MVESRTASWLAVALLAAACSGTPTTPQVPLVETIDERAAAPAAPPDSTTEAVIDYLTLAGRLAIAGDQKARAAIVDELAKDAETAPTPGNRLRLALGQSFVQLEPEDLVSARHSLNRLVASGELSSIERRVADICFDLMERQRRFQDRIATLQGQIDALTAIEQRIRNQGEAQ